MEELDVSPLTAPAFVVRGGRLQGAGAFYCPTSVKFYRRPSEWINHPVAVVLHYTACLAKTRPIVHLNKLLRRAEARLDNESGAIDRLELQLIKRGAIPDSTALTLQNAGRARWASWCFCIGRDPMADGNLAVTQYSPNLSECGTMHAGSPKTWEMRKRFRGRRFTTSRGETRWDGRNYQWPMVDNPWTTGTRVLHNANPYVIGIEMMNVGPYGPVRQARWPGLPKVKIGRRWYEEPSDLQLGTLRAVLRAIREAYGPIPVWGHCDLVPWSKVDPWPPYPSQLDSQVPVDSPPPSIPPWNGPPGGF